MRGFWVRKNEIMTKEEVIKQAYGEYYHLIRNHIGSNGSVNEVVWLQFNINIEYDDFSTGYFRPKSLKGIETNNGWIKIESELDLPIQGGEYDVIINDKVDKATYIKSNRWLVNGNDFPKTTEKHKITHYQPIIKPSKPLY